MNQSHWLLHPIAVFIFSLLALGMSLFLYIYWYIEVSAGLKAVMNRFQLDSEQVLASQTWVVILVLSVLVAIIMVGIFTIFVYNQKTWQLYRLQRNFINNFTHELKTPATSLNLYLETFREYELTREDQLKYIDYMLADVRRLTDHIMRILNLAKIEGQSYQKELTPEDLVAAVEGFLEANAHLFSACQIHIHNPGNRHWVCKLNRSLFEILLMNLFTNAIKYNASPVPTIDIHFQTSGRTISMLFKDNGLGFDPKERKRIFKKFYQIGRPENMSAKGSGLGLYLVQSIARIHKGRVSATSPGPQQGATLTVTLPLITPDTA